MKTLPVLWAWSLPGFQEIVLILAVVFAVGVLYGKYSILKRK
jgi:hypothetical protein